MTTRPNASRNVTCWLQTRTQSSSISAPSCAIRTFFFHTFKSISLCTIKLGKFKYLGTRWIIFLHTLLVISINPGEFFTNPCEILQDIVKNLPKHFAFPRFLYFEWWTKNSQIYHEFFKYDHLIFNFFKEQFYFQILIFLISSSS